ncbi:hypothetical protein O6H91_01G005200 [Diphasiastrum complanatum]|nr:hypothetical protein O6H91_01G005200 [Diphasiastrum complanatum]KAJ7567751.1 hypothetical protein O6H91_01G005200 [Diphasiastrum complanatum]
MEGVSRFCKGIKGLACKKAFQGHAMPSQKAISADNLSVDHSMKLRNVSAAAAAGDGMSSAVQERHASHNGALLSVLPVKEKRSTYLKGNEKGGSQADWLQIGGLVGDGMLYSERFVIRCYEVGTNSRASIETIANLLQEVACNHARSVGFSTDGFATTPSMRKQRLIWVTTRMHIELDEYPAWGDTVEIDTWFQDEGRVGTRRDWVIRKVISGEVIGRATSTWVMMNQDTRRLSRITDDVRAEYMPFSTQPPRWAFPSEHNDSTKKILKLEENAQYIKTGLMPRRGDLDMNQHVNNVTYIGWMLESLPADILNTQELCSVTLEFRRECKHDDTLESMTSPELQLKDVPFHEIGSSNGAPLNGASFSVLETATILKYLHLLRLEGSGIEINRGHTQWRKKGSSRTILHNK